MRAIAERHLNQSVQVDSIRSVGIKWLNKLRKISSMSATVGLYKTLGHSSSHTMWVLSGHDLSNMRDTFHKTVLRYFWKQVWRVEFLIWECHLNYLFLPFVFWKWVLRSQEPRDMANKCTDDKKYSITTASRQ